METGPCPGPLLLKVPTEHAAVLRGNLDSNAQLDDWLKAVPNVGFLNRITRGMSSSVRGCGPRVNSGQGHAATWKLRVHVFVSAYVAEETVFCAPQRQQVC